MKNMASAFFSHPAEVLERILDDAYLVVLMIEAGPEQRPCKESD
jgi:hypothetical protein